MKASGSRLMARTVRAVRMPTACWVHPRCRRRCRRGGVPSCRSGRPAGRGARPASTVRAGAATRPPRVSASSSTRCQLDVASGAAGDDHVGSRETDVGGAGLPVDLPPEGRCAPTPLTPLRCEPAAARRVVRTHRGVRSPSAGGLRDTHVASTPPAIAGRIWCNRASKRVPRRSHGATVRSVQSAASPVSSIAATRRARSRRGGCPEQHGGRATVGHESGDDPGVRLGAVAVERLILGHEHRRRRGEPIPSTAELRWSPATTAATPPPSRGQFGGL